MAAFRSYRLLSILGASFALGALTLSAPASAHEGHGERQRHFHIGSRYLRLCDGRILKTQKPGVDLARSCGKGCTHRHRQLPAGFTPKSKPSGSQKQPRQS